MTSQLNVDTIVDKAGSGGTNVKIGNTSTYVADGGSASQNTVQSLIKAWFNLNSDDSYRDSFNIASLTDNGTGDFSHNFTNAMNNDDFSFTTGTNGSNSSSSVNSYNTYYDPTSSGTGFVRSQNISSGGTAQDSDYVMGMVAGELA